MVNEIDHDAFFLDCFMVKKRTKKICKAIQNVKHFAHHYAKVLSKEIMNFETSKKIDT